MEGTKVMGDLDKMPSCQVCGGPDAETHFGGMSCRACAAFFRRYYNSKKEKIMCTCESRSDNSHPCRECRMQKCLKAGMTKMRVQPKREKHSKKNRGNVEVVLSTASSSQSPDLPYHIVLRDNANISHLISKWANVQYKKSKQYEKRIDEMTLYELGMATVTDCQVMWKTMEVIFPQLAKLRIWDKDALLRNFLPKWALLAAAVDFYRTRKSYSNIRSQEDYTNMIVKFYSDSVHSDCQMKPDEIIRVFEPFYSFYGTAVAIPMCAKKFDPIEYIALAMISLFDGAHTNIGPNVSELCHNIRKVIFRELRGYHSDMECGGEMRFLETIDTLSLLEKGEAKFHEELLLLEMYNIHIHDDYRLMITEHNY